MSVLIAGVGYHNLRDLSLGPLLVPVLRGGKCVYREPSIHESRAHTQAQLGLLHPGLKRFVNPHLYPVGLSPSLLERRTRMILQARER